MEKLSGFIFVFLFPLWLWSQEGTLSGIVKGNGAVLGGANVLVEGGPRGTTADSTGNYNLVLRTGTYSIIFSYVGYMPQTVQVSIADGRNTRLDILLEKENVLDRVEVLGTRSGFQRVNTGSAVPVDVLTVGELQNTGQIEPTQMINFVAPSFNSSRQTISDGTDHIDPATLRGLGPDQVLVLLNGRRRHTTALMNVNGTIGRGSVGTDLNAIPTAMIEKIEVLRDGASSQYGSDAIAGVINVGLKRNSSGFSISTQAGQQYEGDGEVLQVGISKGLPLGKRGFLSVGGDYRFRGATNRVGDYTGRVYTNDAVLDEQLIAQNGFSRKNNMQIGQSRLTNALAMLNGGLPIGEKANFFFNAGFGYREGEAAGFYRYPRQTAQVITELYPNGFLPQIGSTIYDKNVTVGIEGTLADWKWDLSNTWGGNSFRFDVSNSNNASQFALRANAPTAFYAGKLGFNQNTLNLNFSRDFAADLNVLSFNVAAGAEYRIDQYRIEAGEEASWRNYDPNSGRVGGAQVFPGFQPGNAVNESRSVFGMYADVEADLSRRLLVSFAGRFEQYSDYGGNLASKLAARYKLNDWLSIRGSFSNGFRAPSMHQFWFSSVSTVFINTAGGLLPFQQGNFRNNSAVAAAFGIPALKSELSVNSSLGLTARFNSRFTITADAYQININDRIVYSGAFRRRNAPEATIVDGLLGQFPELNDVNSAAFFSNAIDTRTRGLDVVASFTDELGPGTITLTAAANVNRTTVISVNDAGRITEPLLKDRLFSREEQARVEMGQPRDKITLGINYKLGKANFLLRNTRFGKVATMDPNPALADRDETFSPKWITDISIGYQITPWLHWNAGANNLFDIYPDALQNPANTSDGRFIYSRGAIQWGFNGGYYFTGFRVDLRKGEE